MAREIPPPAEATAATPVPATQRAAARKPADERLARLRDEFEACVRDPAGPISARMRAASIGRTYLEADDAGRLQFLALLARDFGPDHKTVQKAYAAYEKSRGTAARFETEMRLREALVSRRSQILTLFNALPQGVRFLVDLRADLLRLVEKDPTLAVLDAELETQLAAWFDVGFLELERITWHSPAAVLEKLIRYEAVHEIRSWNDLKNRLDTDRRCYAFFHPRMPDEPLIFVEVALTNTLSGNVQDLLDEQAPLFDPRDADTAIFYSISNTQKGLRGISFGNFLLKRVVDDLTRELPGLKIFSTLSPIPLLRTWMDQWFAAGRLDPLAAADLVPLAKLLDAKPEPAAVRRALQERRWTEDPALREALELPMARLATHYLLAVKKGAAPLDPVARFHLGNGARVERLNWLADISMKGFNQSYGMMVNYRYVPEEIERNVEAYSRDGRIAATASLAGLLRRSGS